MRRHFVSRGPGRLAGADGIAHLGFFLIRGSRKRPGDRSAPSMTSWKRSGARQGQVLAKVDRCILDRIGNQN
jgi:hypothetical protein